MAVQGKIAEFTYGERNDVYSHNHPAIVLDVNLSNITSAVERGTVIGVDGGGNFVVYDPSATDSNGNQLHKPYGVLIEDYFPERATSAKVLVMGVVYRDAVKVNGSEPSDRDVEALRALNIYVVNRT